MSTGAGALMTPEFVYEAVGPSGNSELFAAQRFAGAAVQKAAAKDPLLAADAITRSLLGPMQPLLSAHESFLSNEMLYLRAAKTGRLAPNHRDYADATAEATAAGVADTSTWRVPSKQEDLRDFIQMKSDLQRHTQHTGVAKYMKRHAHDAPSAAPTSASSLAERQGTCVTTNTPFPTGWMAPGNLKPTGVCGDLGAFDCSDASSPVTREFRLLARHNGKTQEEADAACRVAQKVCHDAGCAGVPVVSAAGKHDSGKNANKQRQEPSHRRQYGPGQCYCVPYDEGSGASYYNNARFDNPYETNSFDNEF